jgi:hypothetical protein
VILSQHPLIHTRVFFWRQSSFCSKWGVVPSRNAPMRINPSITLKWTKNSLIHYIRWTEYYEKKRKAKTRKKLIPMFQIYIFLLYCEPWGGVLNKWILQHQCFFTGKILPNGDFFFKMLTLGKKLITQSFFYCQIFIQFDHFSSIWANFHQFMMIPSKIWTKVLHWCHMLDKWKFIGKTLFNTAVQKGTILCTSYRLTVWMQAQRYAHCKKELAAYDFLVQIGRSPSLASAWFSFNT